MKLFSLSLLFLVVINLSPCQAVNLFEKDYSINIPDNWNAISKARLVDLEKENKIDLKCYIRGYSYNDTLGNEIPYFLLNYTEIPHFENALFKDVISQETKTLRESGIEGNIVVDSSQFKFYYESQLEDYIVLVGFIPGSNGMLYLSYFTDSTNFIQDKLRFLDIYNSVRMHEKFRNVNVHYEEAKEHERKAGQHATRAIIFLGVSVILYLVGRKLKSKSQ